MSIITFWNDSREQTGQTLTTVAVATRMAIERNIKILLISTSVNDSTIRNCYWGKESNKAEGLFGMRTATVAVENGIEGLFKLVTSNKLTPAIITDYTKVVLKGRLEVINGLTVPEDGTNDEEEALKRMSNCYLELIKTANQYYDIVIVDLDKRIDKKIKEDILNISNVNMLMLLQKMKSLEEYNDFKYKQGEFDKFKCIPVIGKYIKQYKYNSKNIARYLQEKQEFDLIPFNLLYMEAAEETGVVELFLKLKNIKDKTDENYIFMQSNLNLVNNIFKKLQDMQMKMR